MADDFNKEPLGDISGASGRKKELDAIRKSASETAAEIRSLAKEFQELSKVKGRATDIISQGEVSKVSALSKTLQSITVSTLKSSKARKNFADQILKAEQDQASILSKVATFEERINERKKEAAAFQSKADKMQKDARDKQLAADEKIAQLTADRTKLENDSFQQLEAARATGDKTKIARAEELHAAEMARARGMENEAKNLSALAKKQEVQDQKAINNAQDLSDAAKEEASNLEGQVNLLKEKATLQGKDIAAAKELQKTMEEIDKAGGSILESFAKLGDTLLKNVPLIGTAFNKIFSELISARKLFQDATAEGTSKLGAMFKATQGFIKSLTLVGLGGFLSGLYDAMKLTSEFSVEVRKGLGGGFIDASKSMAAASEAAGRLTIPITEAAAMVGQLNDSLGTSLGFTGDILTTFGTLTKKIGVSASTAAHLFKISAKIGQPFEELTQNIIGSTEKLNALNKSAVAPKAIFEEIGHASETILRANAKNPDALIKAAHGARMMGMEMSKIEDAARSTLDFENSMAQEMEAELMLGKELNLDRLRAAAATGDVATQQEEIARLVAENKDSLEGNVLAQEMFGKTIGISGEELNKMLNSQDEMAKMTEKDAARKAANAKNEKLSAEEIGQRQLSAMEKMATLSDRINKMIESFKLGIKEFADSVKTAFAPFSSVDFSGILETFKTDGFVAGVKKAFEELGPAIKDTVKNLGTLVMDTFIEAFNSGEGGLLSKGGILGKLLGAGVLAGGALVIAFKGLSALGGVFSKLRGTRFLPMFTKSVDGVGSNNRIGSNIFKHFFRKGGGNFFGRISRVFNRGLLKMFGRNPLSRALSGPKGIISRLNKIKLPNLTKIFSRLKMPNLTNIFSKIKLPNLTNLFNRIKLPKLPNIGKGFMDLLSKFKIPTGAANGLVKTIGGKILAPLELLMGAFTGVNQVKDLTAEQKKEQGIKESMGTTEAGIIGALTGNANKGSAFSEYVGIEKGSAGDEAMGIASAAGRGALTGAALTAWLGPGAAIGAAIGGVIGGAAESFKVFSDPNSKLRKGLSEFATATYDKAVVIGNKIKEGAIEVGTKIKDFAVGVKDKALAFASSVGEGISNFASAAGEKISNFASSVGEGISNFASAAGEKISNFASSVGEGISNFANTARDKAKAFAGAVGEKIGNIRGKIADFLDANDGLVGGIKAAAMGLASKAKNWFGSKVQGLKDWWNGDKSKSATPEIKQEEIKKVTTPLMQMSKDQAKTFTTAINTALSKGADTTIKAMDSLGEVLEEPLMLGAKSANAQMEELKKLKAEGDKQHKAEILELRNQTALLYQYITNPQKSIIKMDSYKVGESLVSRY